MTGIPSLGSSNTPSCLLPQELDTLWLDGPSWLECKLTLSLKKKGKLGNFSFNLSKMWVLFQTLVDFLCPFSCLILDYVHGQISQSLFS